MEEKKITRSGSEGTAATDDGKLYQIGKATEDEAIAEGRNEGRRIEFVEVRVVADIYVSHCSLSIYLILIKIIIIIKVTEILHFLYLYNYYIK